MAFVTAIVLLIACANVANLLLARGRARMREIAVRVAIGAPRRRVVRQLFTEALLLAVAGSVLGAFIATRLARALLPALASGPDPLLTRIGVDWRLLLFVVLVASTAAILFGLVPAFRSSDVHLSAGLEEARRGATAAPRRRLLTGSLVVAQIALSVLLVAGAGLLVRSVRNLARVDLGFNPHNLLLFRIDPIRNGYSSERAGQLYTALLERLRATPGVQSASLSSHRLISNSSSFGAASRLDETAPPRRSAEDREFRRTHGAYELVVDEHFFSTLSIPLLRGRTFVAADAGGELVAVVNRALALQLFRSDDVVGRQFRTNRAPYRIVGVAADARYASLRREMGPTAYLYYPQRLDMKGAPTFEVKTVGPPAALASTIRDIVHDLDPTLPVAKIGTQADQIAASVATERLFAALATLLGLVAVALSAIGLHALLAYGVTQRTPEIGVRMALGADRRTVAWMILKQSLVLATIGLAVGLTAAVAGMRVIQALLFDLRVRDPLTLATAAAIMLIVSATAGYLPARRAARVDPLVALRAE
jgi:predicted permease